MAVGIENFSNINAPDSDFPHGDIRDNPGDGTGTPVNRQMMSDPLQFFMKLMDVAGLTPNGVVDSEYNGNQLFQAFRKLARPYKSYMALHVQGGTSAPTTAPVGFNDLGNIVWTRTGVGEYLGTLSGAFVDATKVIFLTENGVQTEATGGSIRRLSANTVQIRTFSAGSPSDGVGDFTFEIRYCD